jgi:hypothetical protein
LTFPMHLANLLDGRQKALQPFYLQSAIVLSRGALRCAEIVGIVYEAPTKVPAS